MLFFGASPAVLSETPEDVVLVASPVWNSARDIFFCDPVLALLLPDGIVELLLELVLGGQSRRDARRRNQGERTPQQEMAARNERRKQGTSRRNGTSSARQRRRQRRRQHADVLVVAETTAPYPRQCQQEQRKGQSKQHVFDGVTAVGERVRARFTERRQNCT